MMQRNTDGNSAQHGARKAFTRHDAVTRAVDDVKHPSNMPSNNMRSRILRLFTALSIALLCTACPQDGERGHAGKGVLVIAVDCLRADHLSSMGYDRATTPVLDSLARQGTLFTQTYGVAPEYVPAHAGLLTGCDPWICRRPRHGVDQRPGLGGVWWVPRTIPSLAHEYLTAGYATSAFVDHPGISPTYGFDRGFADFFRFLEDDVVGYEDYGFEGVGLRFRRWRRALPADRDWFAYVSVSDLDRSWSNEDKGGSQFTPRPELDWVPPVHEGSRSYFAIPNDARRQWSGGNDTLAEYEVRYDNALQQLDRRIGRVLDELKREGRLENTTICIVGTFGVGFGESGLILDTGTLSDIDLHVPWILRPAAGIKIRRGKERDALASLVDVAPTLLELSGIEPPLGMHGVSQVPVLRDEQATVREYAFARGGVQAGFGVRDQRYSFEHTAPGSRGEISKGASWTGRRGSPSPGFQDYLRDRQSGSGPGNLEPGTTDPAKSRELREVGSQWYTWVDQARDVVHETSWEREPIDPAILSELVEHGIVAPQD